MWLQYLLFLDSKMKNQGSSILCTYWRDKGKKIIQSKLHPSPPIFIFVFCYVADVKWQSAINLMQESIEYLK